MTNGSIAPQGAEKDISWSASNCLDADRTGNLGVIGEVSGRPVGKVQRHSMRGLETVHATANS